MKPIDYVQHEEGGLFYPVSRMKPRYRIFIDSDRERVYLIRIWKKSRSMFAHYIFDFEGNSILTDQ